MDKQLFEQLAGIVDCTNEQLANTTAINHKLLQRIEDLTNELQELKSKATVKTWYSTSEVIHAQLLPVYSHRDNLTRAAREGRVFLPGKEVIKPEGSREWLFKVRAIIKRWEREALRAGKIHSSPA